MTIYEMYRRPEDVVRRFSVEATSYLEALQAFHVVRSKITEPLAELRYSRVSEGLFIVTAFPFCESAATEG